MNTELRNKLFGKIKNVFENEDTQERVAYLEAKEEVDNQYESAFNLARDIVERAYPSEDVATLQSYKKKYGDAVDVVAKDKCFYFAHNEDVNDEDETVETKSHFDFGLYGNLKENNPHKTKNVEANDSALGYGNSSYRSDTHTGITKGFDEAYYLDVIGTSYCRSRAIACTRNEFMQLEAWRMAHLSEGIELATELGIELEEAELLRTNSTGLTMYNPSNLADMIKGMKNKNQSREAKILARKQYEAVN